MRKRALLALSLPLAAAGGLAGHAVGYALVGASRQDARIHGYLSVAPQFLAVCLALVTLALALRLAGRLQGRPAAWPFALLPPLAFVAQELLERVLHGLPGNLDSASGANVIELLAGLAARRGATVIVATHNSNLAERAPRRVAMRDGRIVESQALASPAG